MQDNYQVMTEFDQNTPTALVTGASRGIGKAIAKKLADMGFQIILTYVSRAADAVNVVENIERSGGKAKAFALNVGDREAIKDFFSAEIKGKLNLHVLVNNAGITHDGLLLRMTDENFDKVLNINLGGAFACTREAAKIMTRNRYGRIVNISSVVGQMGNAGQVNYSAAKAGLLGLTKSCAKELASRNITVNAIAPGFIETEMTATLDEKTREEYIRAIPLGRLGTAMDIAEVTAFLVSPAASYITGQTIAVNGGMFCY